MENLSPSGDKFSFKKEGKTQKIREFTYCMVRFKIGYLIIKF